MAEGCLRLRVPPFSRRRPRVPLLWAAALLGLAAAASGAEIQCRPWPGEPEPLPTVSDSESARARWAELRLSELVQRAQLAEGVAPVESYRLWRRALCLDPQNALAWRGLGRTRPVRVYRPEIRWAGQGETPPAEVGPWRQLASPIAVARVSPAPAPGPSPAARRARASVHALELVREAEALLDEARFEEALAGAEKARRALPAGGTDPTLRTRIEVLAATAHVALGDEDAARKSFERALAADPELALDPERTSPKVLRAWREAGGGS